MPLFKAVSMLGKGLAAKAVWEMTGEWAADNGGEG